MKWFRSNIKHGTRLALLALALQFVMGFGHFHGVIAQAAPAIHSDAARSESATTDLVAAAAVVSQSDQQQPGSDHDRQSGDVCAICAVIALANTLLFSTPPLLLLPQTVEFLYLTADVEFVHMNSARVAFQPRAPPVS